MGKKILLVDDEELIANTFNKQLTLIGGFEVDIARGGAEALNKLSETQYEVMLLDLMMPGVDGIEVLKSLKDNPEKYNGTKVIALTNVTAPDVRARVEELGIKKVIIKTNIDPDSLIKTINETIDN